MRLHEFLATKPGQLRNQSDWAREVKVTRGYFNQLVHGTKTPSLQVALTIDKLTSGVVSPYDWPEERSDDRDSTREV